MGKRFSKVSPDLWESTRFRALDCEAQVLLVYYMTSAHQTSAGCYRIPDGYAIADLGWELDRYAAARARLVTAGLIAFDEDANVVFVLRWFVHNPPQNAKHAAGARRMIDEVASDTIREIAAAEFDAIYTPPSEPVSHGARYSLPGQRR